MPYSDEEILKAVRDEGGVVRDAAAELGCSRQTIYNHMKKNPEIKEAVKEERRAVVDEFRDRAKDMARDASIHDRVRWDATIKILTVFDDELKWSDVKRQKVSGPDGEPIDTITLNVVETDPDDFENDER